jgi:hypothetical protein
MSETPFISLFICSLFKDAVSSSDAIAPNGIMIKEELEWM